MAIEIETSERFLAGIADGTYDPAMALEEMRRLNIHLRVKDKQILALESEAKLLRGMLDRRDKKIKEIKSAIPKIKAPILKVVPRVRMWDKVRHARVELLD